MDLQAKDKSLSEEEQTNSKSIEINSLTGLYFCHTFLDKVDVFLQQVEPDTYCMVAMDLEHFRLFNKLYGREQGDCLLIKLSDLLKTYKDARVE